MKMNNPDPMTLSIITVNLNNASGLDKTIASVRTQSHLEGIEHIVIDGGSDDGSLDVLERNRDAVTFISEKDGGIYQAMNKGVSMARGKYLLFLNSGDVLYDRDVLSDIVPELKQAGIVIGRMRYAESGTTTPVGEKITLLYLYESFLPHPACFIKKSLLENHPYDESLRISSDWKFFLQTLILDEEEYSYVDRVVSLYDENGLSSTHGELGEQERQAILRDLFPSRVIADYFGFAHGEGFTGSDYDRFFIALKGYRYGRLMYAIDVFLMKVIALFKKSATFVKSFPGRIKDYD